VPHSTDDGYVVVYWYGERIVFKPTRGEVEEMEDAFGVAMEDIDTRRQKALDYLYAFATRRTSKPWTPERVAALDFDEFEEAIAEPEGAEAEAEEAEDAKPVPTGAGPTGKSARGRSSRSTSSTD
jgi:hypothetical protein